MKACHGVVDAKVNMSVGGSFGINPWIGVMMRMPFMITVITVGMVIVVIAVVTMVVMASMVMNMNLSIEVFSLSPNE